MEFQANLSLTYLYKSGTKLQSWMFIQNSIFQYRSNLPKVKQNLVQQFLLKFPNHIQDLYLKKLGSIIRISNFGISKRVVGRTEFLPTTSLVFPYSNQKVCKSTYQTFLCLSNFTGFLFTCFLSGWSQQTNVWS